MKGQMIFEFIIAAVVFFGIIFYVITYLNMQTSIYSGDYYENELENKAVQISELLVHNPGTWLALPNGPVHVIGLADEWPVLNDDKMRNLGLLCNENYDYFLDLLDTELSTPYGNRLMKVMINITNIDTGQQLMGCGYEPENTTVVKVNRYGITKTGNIVKIVVGVWG